MANNYFSLPRRRGIDNMGGMGVKFRFCALDDMDSVKGLKTSSEPGDKVTIDGSHDWKAGKGCHEIYFVSESVKLDSVPQGELGGMSKKVTGEGFYAGMSKAAAELDRQGGNDEFLCWMYDPNLGKWIQIGSEDFPATIKGTFSSGSPTSGRKGYTFQFEASMLGMAFYEGVFDLAPEAVNSGSGAEDASTFVD